MGGKGSGRPKGNPDLKNRTYKVDGDLNHRIIEFTKTIKHLEQIDVTDADAIERRFEEFLTLCDVYQLRPAIVSYALALGIDRHRLNEVVRHGLTRLKGQELTPKCVTVLKNTYNFLESTLENLLMNDTKNPVPYLFLAKNHYGYRDQTERVNVNIEEKAMLPSPNEIAAKYAAQLGTTITPDVIYELPNGS